MALSAGRVGVAKDQVDEFGRVTGGGTQENVYTKTQCDNKFETKTHANNTFQSINLSVPLELLGGSQLTVESGLHALEANFGGSQLRNNDGKLQFKSESSWKNAGGDVEYLEGEECVIGTYKGETLYQRTFVSGSIAQSGTSVFTITDQFTGVKDVLRMDAIAYSSDGTINPTYATGGSTDVFRVQMNKNTGVLIVVCGTSGPTRPIDKILITVQYTKVTV